MNELVIVGGAIGGVWLLQNLKPASKPQPETAGNAITAAMEKLLAQRPLAAGTVTLDGGVTSDQQGISWTPEPARQHSASANYIAMRDAMVDAFGRVPGATVAPTGLNTGQLADIMTAWLAAYDAGRGANHQNFALTSAEAKGTVSTGGGIVVGWATCATSSEDDRTSLGNAACALSAYRDYMAAMPLAWDASYQYTIETFRLVNALAAEMDGADFTQPGVRNEDQNWKWSDVPGALVYAGEESVKAVVDLAGRGASALAGYVLDSNLFWFAALGFAAYMVLS